MSFTFQKDGIDLKVRYSFEYIDNAIDAEYVASGRHDQGEPWEHYKSIKYDDISAALTKLMIAIVSNQYYDFHLFEEVLVDGETIREQFIEPSQTIGYSMRTWLEKRLTEDHYNLQRDHDTLEKEAKAMQLFIQRMGLQEQFKLFSEKFHV